MLHLTFVRKGSLEKSLLLQKQHTCHMLPSKLSFHEHSFLIIYSHSEVIAFKPYCSFLLLEQFPYRLEHLLKMFHMLFLYLIHFINLSFCICFLANSHFQAFPLSKRGSDRFYVQCYLPQSKTFFYVFAKVTEDLVVLNVNAFYLIRNSLV